MHAWSDMKSLLEAKVKQGNWTSKEIHLAAFHSTLLSLNRAQCEMVPDRCLFGGLQ